MPILNYTTKINTHKTVAEIQQKLARMGAAAVSIDYGGNGLPVALLFLFPIREQMVSFRLPSNWEGVYNKMRRDPSVPKTLKTEDQARKVSWRIIKDWVEAQIALIESDLAKPAEIFLPYSVTSSGKTLYQVLENDPYLLTAGSNEHPPRD